VIKVGIFSYEYTVRNGSKCKKCKRKIQRNELRINYFFQNGLYIYNERFCKKCGIEFIKNEIILLNSILNNVEKLQMFLNKKDDLKNEC
jgi:superfamily II helicase